MRRPLVLLDCDGILSDFVGWFLLKIEQRLGVSYHREDVTRFDFSDLSGWSEISKEAWDLCRAPGFARNMPVLDGAKDGVARLQEIADVEICTSPMSGAPTWTHERDEWLERHFDIDRKNVHHVRKKYRMPADMLLDDSGENADAYRAHAAGTPVLWDRSYNREFDHIRVYNWDGVLREVRVLCNA
jgi:5'(3')-deoxyribonucleotidase